MLKLRNCLKKKMQHLLLQNEKFGGVMKEEFKDIKVVAFDIDGTLYPDYRLYLKIIFYFLKNVRFYVHFNNVRKIMHKTAPLPDFYEYQARLLAEELKCTVPAAKEKIERIVYKGLMPYLERTKIFAHVEDTFVKIKESGRKIAILSDFPPSQKGNMWGLLKYCDLVLGSEEAGALKPSKFPFGMMSMKLGVKPEEILYVGNSVKYDVCGAKNAGMKSALIISPFRKFLLSIFRGRENGFGTGADVVFTNYRQFIDIVLN